MCFSESEGMMQQHPSGFSIICRPSQFARFVVYRYEADECINGMKDLRPVIVDAHEFDPQQEVADSVGVSKAVVMRVLAAVGFSGPFEQCRRLYDTIDVAKRPHQRCYS